MFSKAVSRDRERDRDRFRAKNGYEYGGRKVEHQRKIDSEAKDEWEEEGEEEADRDGNRGGKGGEEGRNHDPISSIRPTLLESLLVVDTKATDTERGKDRNSKEGELEEKDIPIFYTPTNSPHERDRDKREEGEERDKYGEEQSEENKKVGEVGIGGGTYRIPLQSGDLSLHTTNLEEMESMRKERERELERTRQLNDEVDRGRQEKEMTMETKSPSHPPSHSTFYRFPSIHLPALHFSNPLAYFYSSPPANSASTSSANSSTVVSHSSGHGGDSNRSFLFWRKESDIDRNGQQKRKEKQVSSQIYDQQAKLEKEQRISKQEKQEKSSRQYYDEVDITNEKEKSNQWKNNVAKSQNYSFTLNEKTSQSAVHKENLNSSYDHYSLASDRGGFDEIDDGSVDSIFNPPLNTKTDKNVNLDMRNDITEATIGTFTHSNSENKKNNNNKADTNMHLQNMYTHSDRHLDSSFESGHSFIDKRISQGKCHNMFSNGEEVYPYHHQDEENESNLDKNTVGSPVDSYGSNEVQTIITGNHRLLSPMASIHSLQSLESITSLQHVLQQPHQEQQQEQQEEQHTDHSRPTLVNSSKIEAENSPTEVYKAFELNSSNSNSSSSRSTSSSSKSSEDERDPSTSSKLFKSESHKKNLLRRTVLSKKFYKNIWSHSFSMPSLNAYRNEVLRRKEYQDMDEAFNIEKNEDDNIYNFPLTSHVQHEEEFRISKTGSMKRLFFFNRKEKVKKNEAENNNHNNNNNDNNNTKKEPKHTNNLRREGSDSYQYHNGGGIILDIRLLGRPYSLTLKVSAGLLPVSLILTELFRLYVSEHLFNENIQGEREYREGEDGKEAKVERGGRGSSDYSKNVSATSTKRKVLSKQPFIDLHFLIPACKGLLQVRDGILFTVNDKIIIDESISFETYIVVIDLYNAAVTGIDSDFLDTVRSFKLEHDRTGIEHRKGKNDEIVKKAENEKIMGLTDSSKKKETDARTRHQNQLTLQREEEEQEQEQEQEEELIGEADRERVEKEKEKDILQGRGLSPSISAKEENANAKESVKNHFLLSALPHLREKSQSSPGFPSNIVIPNSSVNIDSNKRKGETRTNFVSEPDVTDISVRGVVYNTDKKKVPSAPTAYHLIGLDFLELDGENQGNMSSKETSFPSRLHQLNRNLPQFNKTDNPPNIPFVVCLNFVLPEETFTGYFMPGHGGCSPFLGNDKKFDTALNRFLMGDQAYRNSRLKIVPRCVEGPWAVKSAVGSKPAIIGKKIAQRYYDNFAFGDIENLFAQQYPSSRSVVEDLSEGGEGEYQDKERTSPSTMTKRPENKNNNYTTNTANATNNDHEKKNHFVDEEVKDEVALHQKEIERRNMEASVKSDSAIAAKTTRATTFKDTKEKYSNKSNFLEIEIDITSSFAAQYILGMVKGYSPNVAIDLAFIIQGEDIEELPERVWFALRINQIDFRKLIKRDKWESRAL